MADLRPWILTVAALGLAACEGDGAFAPRPDHGPDVTANDGDAGDVEVEVDDGDAERPDDPDVIDDAAPPGDDDARPPGTTTAVSWLDEAGRPRATDYAVPHEGECVTCHQLDGVTAHIGPTLRNLNRTISLDGAPLNQLDHLVAEGVLDAVEPASAPTLPDYDDDALPLADRARAYLDINCAHCHNPGGWEDGSDRRLDLRYSTPVAQTNLVRKRDDLIRVLENGEMPYLGTTLVDEVGVGLVIEHVRGL